MTKPKENKPISPKEKAQELIDKIRLKGFKASRYSYKRSPLLRAKVKQCALICTEEAHNAAFLTASPIPEKTGSFWQQVKEAISNL